MFKPIACVIGNRLFVAKFGWTPAQILTFGSSDAALLYGRLAGLDILKPEEFLRSI